MQSPSACRGSGSPFPGIPSPALCWLALFAAAMLPSCGKIEDPAQVMAAYRRAAAMPQAMPKQANYSSVNPRWLEDQRHMWFSTPYKGGSFNYLVDMESGRLERLLSNTRLNKALLAQGIIKESGLNGAQTPWLCKAVNGDASEVTISIRGREWIVHRADYRVTKPQSKAASPPPARPKEESIPDGESRISITLENATSNDVIAIGQTRGQFWKLSAHMSVEAQVTPASLLVAAIRTGERQGRYKKLGTPSKAGEVLRISMDLPSITTDLFRSSIRKAMSQQESTTTTTATPTAPEIRFQAKAGEAIFEVNSTGRDPDSSADRISVPGYDTATIRHTLSRSPIGSTAIGIGYLIPPTSDIMLEKKIWLRSGESLPQPRMALLDLKDHRGTAIDFSLTPDPALQKPDLKLTWAPDGKTAFFTYIDRSHQLHRELAIDATTGKMRIVVEERSKTFVSGDGNQWRSHLHASGELLWMSRRDGWDHLYLYDSRSGKLSNQVTRGPWVVRSVLRVDEKARTVWFLASGLVPEQNPYQQHLCRIQLDGTGFQKLSTEDGDHQIRLSPDNRWYIDTWSRPDLPPISNLRRTADGTLVTRLTTGNHSNLTAAGWQAPERFVAKGRDGKTDIWGLIYKPHTFTSTRKYPVVEHVYGGPHTVRARPSFQVESRLQALAEQGFVVVVCDGMGSNFRGRAFQEVAHRNLADSGFPDRILWIKEAAKNRPWMDLSRIGIEGTSHGGYTATRALIDHHDFYDIAVSDCGSHDARWIASANYDRWLNRMSSTDYKPQSNLAKASAIQGRLLLLAGGKDPTVPITLNDAMVTSLQYAKKQFEMMIVPSGTHGVLRHPTAHHASLQFFSRHLLGIDLSQKN